MTYMVMRGQVGDFDAWKERFDSDPPRARESATGYTVLRNADDPGEVFVQVEFPTRQDAEEGRRRLVDSGVLERLEEHTGPTLCERVEAVSL
jgi:hypothetical protein